VPTAAVSKPCRSPQRTAATGAGGKEVSRTRGRAQTAWDRQTAQGEREGRSCGKGVAPTAAGLRRARSTCTRPPISPRLFTVGRRWRPACLLLPPQHVAARCRCISPSKGSAPSALRACLPGARALRPLAAARFADSRRAGLSSSPSSTACLIASGQLASPSPACARQQSSAEQRWGPETHYSALVAARAHRRWRRGRRGRRGWAGP
jgi:hypothetical protein